MTELSKKRNSSLLGILLQIPIWIFALLGEVKLLSIFVLSFTSYDVITAPKFTGVSNYVFSNNEIVKVAMSNTVIFVIAVGLMLIFTAVIPALFVSRLRLPFGIAIIGGYTLISVSAFMPSVFGYVFSGDSYGALNSLLLKWNFIDTPVNWITEYAAQVTVFLLYLFCLAVVFTVTYIAARLKRGALGSAIALCIVPILMTAGKGCAQNVIGYPSYEYSAEWLPTIIYDYAKVRLEMGIASALTVVEIGMLLVWCTAICGAIYGIYRLLRIIHRSAIAERIIGFILFARALGWILLLCMPAFLSFQNSFKPLDEFFTFSLSLVALRPTFDNFNTVFELYNGASGVGIITNMGNLVYLFLVYILVILPCAAGFVFLKSYRRREMLLLPLIALLALTPEWQINYSVVKIQIGNFISGLACAILIFISYFVIKMALYPHGKKGLRLVLGIFCLFTSFIAVGCACVNFNTTMIYSESEKNWYLVNNIISGGGLARLGVASAGNVLLLLFTVITVIAPLVLLILIFIVYKRDKKLYSKTIPTL